MAIFNRFTPRGGIAGFDKRDPRDELIRRPAEEAQDRMTGVGLETLAFLGALPQAFARSQERELKRLLSTGKDENDPRVVALKTTLERMAVLQETAAFGQARIDRMLEPVDRSEVVFSGFVSDDEMRPLPGRQVRVSEPQGASLSAVTDARGQFRIVIGKNTPSSLRRDAGLVGAILGAKADPKNEAVKAAAAAPAQAAANAAPVERVGKVEILDRTGKPLYEDPHPLPLYGGRNLYREYTIAADAGGGSRPFRGGGAPSSGRGPEGDADGPVAGPAAAPAAPAPAPGAKPAAAGAKPSAAGSASPAPTGKPKTGPSAPGTGGGRKKP